MATIYVDPSRASNGNGSLATPYNTWAGVTLTANNTYLQKRGTTYVGASVRPASQSSAAATPLTIGAYFNADGSDDATQPKPIIDHNGGTNGVGAVFIDTCQNVVVRDIDGRNSLASYGAGISVRRSQNVFITRCVGRDSQNGIFILQDQASATSTTTDITVDSCEARDNTGTGICLAWAGSGGTAVATAILKRIVLRGNVVTRNGSAKSAGGTIPCGGIMSWTPVASKIPNDSTYLCLDVVMTDNVVSDNYGYGLTMERVGNEQWVSTIARNEVSGSGKSLDIDSHSLWCGSSFGVLIEDNYVHDNYGWQGGSIGSGVGIFVDYNIAGSVGGADCIVRHNVVERQFKGTTSAFCPSSGIHVLNNQRTVVESNIVLNCRQGISVGPSTTDSTQLRNNALVDIVENGVANNTSTTNTKVQNNIISGAATGIFCATSGTTGFAENDNDLHACTTPRSNGTFSSQVSVSIDASDITSDPLFVDPLKPWLGLKPGSPCQSAGAYVQGARDRFGRRYLNPPNIGPWAVIGR